MSFSADPYYLDVHGPAGWVRREVEKRGIRVRVIDNLAAPGYSTADGQTIVVRPALTFPTFHWIVACGVVGRVFGFDVTPDLQVEGPPSTVAGSSAKVIQLHRRVVSGPVAGGLPR